MTTWWTTEIKKPEHWVERQDIEMIDSFTGKYRWLSNFEPSTIEMDGLLYRTVEHAYQAAKTIDVAERIRVQRCDTPGIAKKLGQQVRLRKDWEDIKVDVMTKLVRKKFSVEPLRSKLLETGASKLIEGNWWQDTFWGVCRGKGQNKLGKILMKVRTELQRGCLPEHNEE